MSYQAGLTTAKLYKSVIDEVFNNCRDAFMDEGIDEQVLQEFKQIWESKVLATKAVDSLSDHPPPSTGQSSSGGASGSGSSHGRSTQQSSSHSAASSQGQSQPSQTAPAPAVVPAAIPAPVIANAASSQPVNAVAAAAPNHATATQSSSQPASVLVNATGLAQLDPVARMNAAAAAAAGFPFQSASAINYAAYHPGVITGPGGHQSVMQSVLIPDVTGNIRYGMNAAQLPTIPAGVHQQNVIQRQNVDGNRNGNLPQVDGPTGISDDEEDFDDDDDAEPIDEPAEGGGVEVGEPLNSEDDVSNEDAEEMFDADNVVVCQYEKVTRTRNKWKFILKDGVMNLDGKDYVFNRANGEAEF